MVISLIHPSWGRPIKGYNTAQKWIDQAGVKVEHIFSLDDSDDSAKSYKALDKLIIRNNRSVVQATNRGAEIATGDVLVYLSDDFNCFNNWGVTLTAICQNYHGEYLIKVHDGLQRFEAEVLTIPIMSRALYQSLGYLYHPAYLSMWVDVDLFFTCQQRGVIKNHREICFEHEHYSVGKMKQDDTNRRSDANWNQGKQVLQMRKREGFK